MVLGVFHIKIPLLLAVRATKYGILDMGFCPRNFIHVHLQVPLVPKVRQQIHATSDKIMLHLSIPNPRVFLTHADMVENRKPHQLDSDILKNS